MTFGNRSVELELGVSTSKPGVLSSELETLSFELGVSSLGKLVAHRTIAPSTSVRAKSAVEDRETDTVPRRL